MTDPERLEVELATRSVDDAGDGVVAHREQVEVDPEGPSQPSGDLGQRVALVEQARPRDVDRPVEVADLHELTDAGEAPPAGDLAALDLTVVGQWPGPAVEAGGLGELADPVVRRG